MADIAHAGNFVRLHELEENGTVSLTDYPNVTSYGSHRGRESFKPQGELVTGGLWVRRT